MTRKETIRCGMERQKYLVDGGRENETNDPIHRYGVKQRSCLDDLPY